jgi:hypothetical protein
MFGYQSLQASLIISLVSLVPEGRYFLVSVNDINNVGTTRTGKLG